METETIFLSKCCKEKAIADWIETPAGGEPKTVYTCTKCEKECEVDEVCAECLGTGEVTTMEYVYPGEPHMAPIGTKPCLCQIKEPDEMDDNS